MSQRSLLDFGESQKRKADDESSVETPAAKKCKKKNDVAPSPKSRVFQKDWLKQFDWLEYDSERQRMFCKTCRAANMQSSFTKEGAGNLQRSTIVKHNTSKDHKNAVEAVYMRRQLYDVPTNNEEKQQTSSCPVKDAELHLFRATYFVAKELQPNSAVNAQMRFLKLSGITDCVSDIHNDSVKEVQKSLLYVLEEDLKRNVYESENYGIIVDESTDLSIHKKLVIYIRYVSQGEIKTEMIGNIRIPDGKANTIYSEIISALKTLGLDVKKCVGLGSDGASVMFGKKGGLGVQLEKEAPYLTHVHCVAQHLSLACSDAAKDVLFLRSYKDTLKNLYIHVSGSGIRVNKLESMQKVMEEPQLRVKDPINVRWLAMENAVIAIHKCYGSIVAYQESNEGKNTVGDVIADGLLKEVSE